MPLKTLVAIILRFFALGWLVTGFSTLLIFLPMIVVSGGFFTPEFSYGLFLMPLAMVLGSVLLWASTSRLSAVITKGHDTELTFSLLTREDLYCFAFVFLGLYFILNHMEGMLLSTYQFFAIGISLPENDPQKGKYLSSFFSHVIPLIVGFACVLGAKSWTLKLMRLENKNENSTATTPTT
jgi:hypothetical protein